MKRLFWEWGIPILLAALYWWLTMSATENKSTEFDELGQVAAGYSYMAYNDFRLLPESGMFPMRWAALPLAFSKPWFPSRDDPWWDQSDYDGLGREFLFASRNDPAEILWETRSMIALLGAALGLIIYFWSKSIFGRIGATISLLLYVLLPLSLALGGYVLSDLAVALFFSAATWSLWHSFHKISPWSILAGVGSVTGLFLSKFSAALIVPIALLLLIVRLAGRKPLIIHFRKPFEVTSWQGQAGRLLALLAVQAVLVWILIWGAYGFRYCALLDKNGQGEEIDPNLWKLATTEKSPVVSAIETMREAEVLPEAFLYGAAHTWWARHTTPALVRVVYLDGEYSLNGIAAYFPCCVLYKTPLGTFAVLFMAAWAFFLLWKPGKKKKGDKSFGTDIFYQLTPVVFLSCIYWATVIDAPAGNAIRYLFPTYPPLFVLAGAAGYWFSGKHRLAQAVVCLGLAVTAVESFSIRPYYAAFFNCFAGGPGNGYKHLLDQDDGRALPDLKLWLDKNVSAQETVYLSYFGHSSPSYYQVRGYGLPSSMFLELPEQPAPTVLTGGIYCISAQNLVCNHLLVIGKWAVPYENLYQKLLADSKEPPKEGGPQSAEEKAGEYQKKSLFEWLQFDRLCAFLRHREPDAQVAYSILIYRLTDQDIQQALFGPPVELLPKVGVKGYPELLR